MAAGSRVARWRFALLLTHALLGCWAVHAWATGPWRGAPGPAGMALLHEALDRGLPGAALDAGAGPLHLRLLGAVLRAGGDVALSAGGLGVLSSLAVLLGLSRLCRRLGLQRAELPAMALYALAGSPLAFVAQPLPVLPGTALLLWGVLLLQPRHPARAPVPAALAGGGLLLAAAVLVWPLLLPAGVFACWAAWRAVRAARPTAASGAARLAALLAPLLLLAAVAWLPERCLDGAALRLRLGNGGARSGTTDVRPGPVLERLRLEPVIAAWEAGAPEVRAASLHAGRAAAEAAADPAGAAATLLRKLFLFWHREELVGDADARHALSSLPPLPLLLLLWGAVAPLALASLRRHCTGALWAPVCGVLLVNVVLLTGAAERFAALPFLCIAAGAFLADRPGLRGWLLAGALGVLLAVNWTGRPLRWPGDGALRRGELLLDAGLVDPAASALTEAATAGTDPRAALLLGMAFERAVPLHGDLSLRDAAERWYREALLREPLHPEAADALLRLLVLQARGEEAWAFGTQAVARDPWAGGVRLSLAALAATTGQKARSLELLAEGYRLLALAALARGDAAGVERARLELLRLRESDPRLDVLARSAAN